MEFQRDIEDILVPSQQYFVYQLAHKYTSIKSDDGKPWIRCIGFTQTLDGARALAKQAFEYGNKTETRIMPVGKVFLAGCYKYEGLDLPRREEEQIKAVKLYNDWVAYRESIQQNFQEKKEDNNVLASNTSLSNTNNIITSRPPTPIPPEAKFLPFENVSHTTISYQSQIVWACGIVPDSSELNEHCLIPLFASENMDTLTNLVKDAAKCKDLYHIDIFIGNIGEWLPLTNPQAEKKLHHNPLLQEAHEQLKWVHSLEEEKK